MILGDGQARLSGYPTANVAIASRETNLKSGVYAAWATLAEKKYPAALVIHETIDKVEVHLLGYIGPDFYGLHIEVDPVQKVSEVERLDMTALLKKIEHDVQLVKNIIKQSQQKRSR